MESGASCTNEVCCLRSYSNTRYYDRFVGFDLVPAMSRSKAPIWIQLWRKIKKEKMLKFFDEIIMSLFCYSIKNRDGDRGQWGRLSPTLSAVSTTTTERAFLVMSVIKTRLRNKMEDDFLFSNMLVYIEKEIVDTFPLDYLIDEFEVMRIRRDQFQMFKPSLPSVI